MHKRMVDEIIAVCRERFAAGDCAKANPFTAEQLEDAIIELAASHQTPPVSPSKSSDLLKCPELNAGLHMTLLPCPFCGVVPTLEADPLGSALLFVQQCCTPDCGRRGIGGAWGTKEALDREAQKWNYRADLPV